MSNSDVITDPHREIVGENLAAARHVYDTAVLNVAARADVYRLHIAAQRTHRPDRTISTNMDIADYERGWVNERAGIDVRSVALVTANSH